MRYFGFVSEKTSDILDLFLKPYFDDATMPHLHWKLWVGVCIAGAPSRSRTTLAWGYSTQIKKSRSDTNLKCI